jgi:uncharacterized protein (UPF0297 family)
MNTDFHYIPDNQKEQIEHILCDVTSVFNQYGYENLKADLWNLTKSVTSENYEGKIITTNFSPIVNALKNLVEGSWQLLEKKKRFNFKDPYFEVKQVINPYRQSLKDRSYNDGIINSHLARFKGAIQYLSKEESLNFEIAIGHFFNQLNVLDWTKLLDSWELYAASNTSIAGNGEDQSPLDTYEHLMKLIEISYLVNEWDYSRCQISPNEHLFDNETIINQLDLEDMESHNPLVHINMIMADYNAGMLKIEIADFFDSACSKDTIWKTEEPGHAIKFCEKLICLWEAGWLLIQSDEIPDSWMDPNQFENCEVPKRADLPEDLFIHHLKKKEIKNPARALSKIYRKTDMSFKRRHIREMLWYAMQTKRSPCDDHDNLRKKLFILVEALYLINFEVCSRISTFSRSETSNRS